jgi:1,4-dihydroxy-2-naphthoate octaprenyltransferase
MWLAAARPKTLTAAVVPWLVVRRVAGVALIDET